MRRQIIALICAGFVLTACKTTDIVSEPAVVPMTEDAFASALESAKADPNPFAGEQKLTALIESKAVDAEKRSRALYARGLHRWKKISDKAGAKADFDKYVELYPAGTFTTNATYESGYVQAEIDAAQARLRTLQTLRAWFDDTWALGKRDEAAARYRRSGLTPEPHQLYALRSTGYVCEGSGNLKLHNYGPLTREIQDLYWCK